MNLDTSGCCCEPAPTQMAVEDFYEVQMPRRGQAAIIMRDHNVGDVPDVHGLHGENLGAEGHHGLYPGKTRGVGKTSWLSCILK